MYIGVYMTQKKFRFFFSLPYLITLSLTTLGFWYFGLERIGIPIFIGAIFILLILKKNTMPVVPLLLNPLFMISQTSWSMDSIPTYLYFVPVALILGFLIHVIRFRVKLFRGELLIGLALMTAALFLSLINAQLIDMTYWFLVIVGIFYIFVYFFFVNSIEGDNTQYLIKLFVILGLLVSVEVFLYYVGVDDVVTALKNKTINLGWGISNFIATYLVIFISATVYYVKKFKMHIIWALILFFEIAMLIFTLSRGGILAFAVTSILLVVYMFVQYEHKLNLLINLVIGLAILAAIFYWKEAYITTIWDRLKTEMLTDSGRFAIWQAAFDKFKAHPLFGVGLYSRVIDGNYLGLNHNTIIQTAAAFGCVGLLALLVMFIEVLKIFFYKLNHEKAILLIALFGANIHGMVDNIFYMPQFMIIFFIIIAVVEIANKNTIIIEPAITQ